MPMWLPEHQWILEHKKLPPQKKRFVSLLRTAPLGDRKAGFEPNLDSDFLDMGCSNTFPKVLGKKLSTNSQFIQLNILH